MSFKDALGLSFATWVLVICGGFILYITAYIIGMPICNLRNYVIILIAACCFCCLMYFVVALFFNILGR